jgi:hypothetical protein
LGPALGMGLWHERAIVGGASAASSLAYHSQGGTAFLAKPFTSEQLLAAVTALLAAPPTFQTQRKPVAGV